MAALISFAFWKNQRLGAKAKLEIFYRCKSHLDTADILIAVFHGPQVDDSTAWEIGYFYARKSPEQKIIGVGLISGDRVRVKAH